MNIIDNKKGIEEERLKEIENSLINYEKTIRDFDKLNKEMIENEKNKNNLENEVKLEEQNIRNLNNRLKALENKITELDNQYKLKKEMSRIEKIKKIKIDID